MLRGIVEAPGGKGEADMSVREEIAESEWSGGGATRSDQMYGEGGDEGSGNGSLTGETAAEGGGGGPAEKVASSVWPLAPAACGL